MRAKAFCVLIVISVCCFGQSGKYKKLTDTLYNNGEKIIAPEVRWSLGKAELLPESKDSIFLIVKWMKKHPCFKIEIGCHTDSRGNPASCMNLSAARAQSIVDCMVKEFNVLPNMVVAKGYGHTQPRFSEEELKKARTMQEKETFHQGNRRTEIKILWINYKTFNDTSYSVSDKILSPEIIYGSCRPIPEAKDSLNVIADFLTKHPTFKIEIGSHTDTRGKAAANMTLSIARAQSMVDYLVKEKGFPANRIVAKGYGASDPYVSDAIIKAATTQWEKEALHAKNRRTVVRILAVQ